MNDPKRYRRMCEPFPSLEATQDAITGARKRVRESK